METPSKQVYSSEVHESLRQEVIRLKNKIDQVLSHGFEPGSLFNAEEREQMRKKFRQTVKDKPLNDAVLEQMINEFERQTLLDKLNNEADTKSLVLAHYLKSSQPEKFKIITYMPGSREQLTSLILATPKRKLFSKDYPNVTREKILKDLPALEEVFEDTEFGPGNLLKISGMSGYSLFVFQDPITKLISYGPSEPAAFRRFTDNLGLTESSAKYLYS